MICIKKPKERKIDQQAYYENDPRLRGQKEPSLPKPFYKKELFKLQTELVKLQEWTIKENKKILLIFEGRDAAGKGGLIKSISKYLNPRYCRVVALPQPTEKERTQWYFQRHTQHLPAGGELVLFDRSWYNRAGVEKVMGWCDEEEYQYFLKACPAYESLLTESGITLIKYWLSVSNIEQEKRLQARRNERHKHWKLSPTDIESLNKWQNYSRAKDTMFKFTDTSQCPWIVVPSDDKKRAKLNCIAHLLSTVPYKDISEAPPLLPQRTNKGDYRRPSDVKQNFVPKVY